MLLLLLAACDRTDVQTPDTDPGGPAYSIPSFTLADGLDVQDMGRGVSVLDANNDGLLDVLSASSNLSYPGGSSVQLHLQKEDGSYERVTEAWGLRSQMNVWGLVPMDYDNDGVTEILLTGSAWDGPANNLWLTLSEDGPAFEEGPMGACGHGATMGGSVDDLNRDGVLDLVMANGSAHAFGGCTDVLLGGPEGVTRMTNAGRGTKEGFGSAVHDLTGDGFPDIMITEGPGVRIYENLGKEPWFDMDNPDHQYAFRVRPIEQEPEWIQASLAALLLDYDQDGDLDPFICTYGDPDMDLGDYQVLLRNDGNMQFTDVTEEAGVAFGPGCMGAGAGDVDLNGYPDLYLGTGGPGDSHATDNVLYLNQGDGSFLDATHQADVAWNGRTHGIEFSDMNRDGQMDMIVNSGGAMVGQDEGLRVALNTGGPFHGVPVVIQGPANNPDGVGARVVAETDAGTFYAYNLRGTGFGSSNLGPVWVGVGSATTATVRVEFPDGTTTTSEPLSLPVDELTLRWGD